MLSLLFTDDPKQSLRMLRHLAAILSLLAFTIACAFFFHKGLIFASEETFTSILLLFWAGFLSFTVIIRSGLNQRFKDPSLTVAQLLWGATFLLTSIYLMNEWRGLMLMAYFAMFSFGFFKLPFRELLSVALYGILGYALIILYLFLKEPERLDIELELLQLLAFSITLSVMVYTGSSIHRLRTRARNQYVALQQALDLNSRLATTDDLTGLYNRRYFMEMLSTQKAVAERSESDFVLCFCDLDHFKHINDTFGHHTGDIVLQQFATILNNTIREIDYAARFGGEEFVILLVNTDIEDAKKVSERIRQRLAEYNFSDIAPALNATVSIGLASFKEFNTIQETLMTADDRMFKAKEQGRNKVVFDDAEVVAG
ncbi:MAG TPA: GGDEF domain-containing protein [Gammaproteobacteria bacterium]|nr:GGDEF domain-containing protein [Gammaproteobacteria bacterium]